MRGDLDKRMFIFIEVFIFIVWGVKDMVLNKNLLEFSKKYIKDCIIKYVEEVIYWVQMDVYEDVNKYIWDFVKV